VFAKLIPHLTAIQFVLATLIQFIILTLMNAKAHAQTELIKMQLTLPVIFVVLTA